MKETIFQAQEKEVDPLLEIVVQLVSAQSLLVRAQDEQPHEISPMEAELQVRPIFQENAP